MSEVQTGGSGRKKSFEPNLVPFIDLMSVLITFLLITAVWSQVSMIQIGTSIYGKKSEDKKPVITEDNSIALKLEIRDKGYALTVARQVFNFPKVNNEYDDQALVQQLEFVKQQYPTKVDAAVAMADELSYEILAWT
jgi:biopolymer transport protein TolR